MNSNNELLDFFDMDTDKPTDSAFNQQRAKLKPEALQAVFHKFNQAVDSLDPQSDYRFLAADGSTATFFILKNQQYFLFRTKDIHSKGLVGGFDFPNKEAFDIDIDVTLIRSHSLKIKMESSYRRFVDKATFFDFMEYGSMGTYCMTFRVVRFPISDGSYECVVTNLPRDEFPPERIRKLYFSCWGMETSFRKLKYTVGLSNFHA